LSAAYAAQSAAAAAAARYGALPGQIAVSQPTAVAAPSVNNYMTAAGLATGTSQAAPTAATQYMTAAEPYLAAAASNNIGPVPGYGASLYRGAYQRFTPY